MTIKVAVIYYSVTGTVRTLADALADGAQAAGADVRIRRVAELTPRGTASAESGGQAGPVDEATLDDLSWADAFAFGTPTRFGAPAAELKYFIDQTTDLWQAGVLADKPVTVFTSAYNRHGGNESTILSLSNVFYHWGSVLVPPGYTDAAIYRAGGNPYGASLLTAASDDERQAACRPPDIKGNDWFI